MFEVELNEADYTNLDEYYRAKALSFIQNQEQEDAEITWF